MNNKPAPHLAPLAAAALAATSLLASDAASPEVRIESCVVAGVPTRLYLCDAPEPHPLLLLSHGFTGDKDRIAESYNAPALARRGWAVVCIDNRLHGERPGPRFDVAVIHEGKEIDLLTLRSAIKETADDIPALLDELLRDPRIDASRIAMSGMSMGGFVTFRAMSLDPRIGVAAPLIASPHWDDVPQGMDVRFLNTEESFAYAAEHQPASHPEKFAPCPLLVQIGAADPHYDAAKVRAFCEALAPAYREHPGRIAFRAFPGVAHDVTPEMRAAAIEWLERGVGLIPEAARPHPTTGKSVVREDEYTVDAPPERVFPLLCPTREYEWLPGWQCDLLRSTGGFAEQDCVFRTVRADSGTMTWVVDRYEPPRLIQFTCFNTTTEHVMRMSIALEPTPAGGTRLRWRRHWIATGPAGDQVVDRFDDAAHRKLMDGVEHLMKYYLAHGALPPPEPAKG